MYFSNYNLKLGKLLSVLFVSVFLVCQISQAQERNKQKKNGGFWKVLSEAITVDGEPIKGSGLSFRVRKVSGEWKEYGAGGNANSLSPRNFAYSFSTKGSNTELSIERASVLRTSSQILSESGRRYDLFSPGNEVTRGGKRIVTLVDEGQYTLYIGAPRGSKGVFTYTLEGSVSELKPLLPGSWTLPVSSFGPEGGGASRNPFSPRNHAYIFEPSLDTYLDINLEPGGTPVRLTLVDPSGKVIRGEKQNGASEIQFLNYQARQKGPYIIWVSTGESNGRGGYTLSVMGNLIKNPERMESNFKSLTSKFNQASSVHKYFITAEDGTLEYIYRSLSQNASIEFHDSYGQRLSPHFSDTPTGRLQNQAVKIPAKSTVILTITNQNPESEGTYEFLLWGNFSEVKKEEMPGEGGDSFSSDNQKNLSVPSPNTILVKGSLSRSGQVISNLVKIIVDDLEKGERIGEIKPDASGNYKLYLPIGKQYSITALTPGDQIASSSLVDLSKNSAAAGNITIAPITIVSATDVGGKLTLNNIFFDTGSPILLRQSYAELKRVAAFLKANTGVRVQIAGHTDSVGDDASNLNLSQNRANSVLYYLQDQIGDNGARLKAKGYGRTEPVASNNTDAGRQQNRRVEFRIVK